MCQAFHKGAVGGSTDACMYDTVLHNCFTQTGDAPRRSRQGVARAPRVPGTAARRHRAGQHGERLALSFPFRLRGLRALVHEWFLVRSQAAIERANTVSGRVLLKAGTIARHMIG